MKGKYRLVLILSLLISSPAMAGDRVPGGGKAGKFQKIKIASGIKSGELTRREARFLIREQRTIQRMKVRAGMDGKVTLPEKARIRKFQKRANRHIYGHNHNRCDRF